MKRAERHHLKENELQTFARDVRDQFEGRQREAMLGLAAVGVVVILAIAFFAWRERMQSQAEVLGIVEHVAQIREFDAGLEVDVSTFRLVVVSAVAADAGHHGLTLLHKEPQLS